MKRPSLRKTAFLLFAILAFTTVLGCRRNTPSSQSGAQSVVLYTSVDEPYARPLIKQFEKETGITVTLLTDAEASKSVGLAAKLEAEKDHPQADVWWDNECFLSERLAGEGVLAPYDSPVSADLPAQFKDSRHLWAGSLLRVRVLVTSPKAAKQNGKALRLNDLLRPEWKGQIAIARPTAGTTGGHVAALYAIWGQDRADTFFNQLRANGVTMVGGNSVVGESVARGDFMAGICDNDDAASAATEVGKLDMALPDQGSDEDGTLAMPCAVGLIAGAPHPDAAKRLIDFLLSSKSSRPLLESKFGWCSARDLSKAGKFMKIDYRAVAAGMPEAIRRATAILESK